MSIDSTIGTMVTAYNARKVADAALANSEDKFELSARATFNELASGTSAAKLAGAGKVKVAELRAAGNKDKMLTEYVYTSGAAIGFHAVTGSLLMLEGNLPVFNDSRLGSVIASANDAQAFIKQAGQVESKRIIASSTTKAEAFMAILKVARDKSKATPAVVAPVVPTETSVAEMLASIASIVSGAVKREDWTAENVAAAREIAKALVVKGLPAQKIAA